MRLLALYAYLGFSVTLCGHQKGSEYSIYVRRVNTERGVKITATLYVREDKYKVQTECFSSDTDYPCIVPSLGVSSVRYHERDGRKLLQLQTTATAYGQQT